MAAWFLGKNPRRAMPYRKLIKLLYMAERTAIKQMGYPILGDHLVSTPYGPALRRTLNYMKKDRPPHNGWTEWISPIKDHAVSLARDYNPEDLDLLSEATLDILAEVWYRFGHMDHWKISEYTLQNCREWENPMGSSLPISYERILRVLGHSEEKAAEIAEELEDRRELGKILLS